MKTEEKIEEWLQWCKYSPYVVIVYDLKTGKIAVDQAPWDKVQIAAKRLAFELL